MSSVSKHWTSGSKKTCRHFIFQEELFSLEESAMCVLRGVDALPIPLNFEYATVADGKNYVRCAREIPFMVQRGTKMLLLSAYYVTRIDRYARGIRAAEGRP
jgi:hypothetical protein